MPLLQAPSSATLSFLPLSSQPKAGLYVAENCCLLCNSPFPSHRHLRPLSVASTRSILTPKAASVKGSASVVSNQTAEAEVLKALAQIIDPDFGTDIVSCGFVKDLLINEALGEVSFRLELTTPACPVKDMVNETQTPLFDQELMCVSSGT